MVEGNEPMITVYSDRMEINWINMVGNKVGDNNTLLNETRQTIIAEIRNNPNVTKAELTRQVFYFCNIQMSPPRFPKVYNEML